MSMNVKVAVVGAGIYGCTTAIKLSEAGMQVDLYDSLGILQAASAINQYRIHSGYHYPRSRETIEEILEARDEFVAEYRPSIVDGIENFYAMPKEGSYVSPQEYAAVMEKFNLPLEEVRPEWMDFEYIDKAWKVRENIYCADVLRKTVVGKLQKTGINFNKTTFHDEDADNYDHVVYATYGLSGAGKVLFPTANYQVAEKILIRLPEKLQGVSLVVVDGPFTAFDPYCDSEYSLFGSARYTNRWVTQDYPFEVPEEYRNLLNHERFEPTELTNFEHMRSEAMLVCPDARDATYQGSRFTIRVVEHNPQEDKRTLYVKNIGNKHYIFSGKVVSAVKAARLVTESILNG